MRAFLAADLPALAAMDALCFPPQIAYSREELSYFLNHPRSTSLVAEQAGAIAGFCIVDWKMISGRKVGHFITIDVAPDRRREGIGETLIKAGEQILQQLACAAVSLEVAVANHGAQEFYGRMGYRENGHIPGYYADGTDALVMQRPLSAPSSPADRAHSSP